ncbi:MAG: serine hydrolase domain-containing protein [Isosphaeraceae bacterium]
MRGASRLVACLATVVASAGVRADEVVSAGPVDPRLASFDQLMGSFVAERKVPGASLAVAREGRLVYARGFGHADPERAEPVGPDALFRVASLSKPITALTVMVLVERGALALDDRALDRLGPEYADADHPPSDPRWAKVTLRELLEHRGGWDRDVSFDPMFRAVTIAREQGVEPPAGPSDVIHWMLKRPLDFDPGARYAYSNFGYCVLGRVIERATGEPYGEAVARLVLRPLGITDDAMRLGETLAKGRAPHEVRYFAGGKTGPSVFPPIGEAVPEPYGAWNLEAMDAHGGWIATAPALLRFARALDVPGQAGVIRPETVPKLFERPLGAAGFEADGKPKPSFYGLGWNVRPIGNRELNTWHTGSLPGTSTLLVRRRDGLSWAVLFNTRDGTDGQVLSRAIDPLLHRAADAVKEWP